MSLRTLPAAPILARQAIGNRGAIHGEAAPQEAFDRWDVSIRAAKEEDNSISVLGVIGEDFFGNSNNTVRRISAALRSIGERDIVVNIHSPGGDFFEGLAIYNALREHKGKVTVKILGLAASAASIVAMSGDEIKIGASAFYMIHCTQALTVGDRHDHQRTVDLLEPFDTALASIYSARTGMTTKAVAKLLDEGTWIGGDDAVSQKFADALLPADEAVSDPAKIAATAPIVATHKLDAILARATEMSRADRRKFVNEIRGGKPGAAPTGMPGAADQESPLGDVLSALRSIKIP